EILAENVTDISIDELISVDLGLLVFEKLYEVSLICHFGEVSVTCGQTTAYTALPLHWTTIEGDIIIHAAANGLGGWTRQERQCQLGAGTLVSLANSFEDDRLLGALSASGPKPSIDTYWLGLNMCPENEGSLWSDGSLWGHSRLPNVGSMLGSGTCCIKAVWNPVMKYYTWLGEACDALLPGICEYHPQGMVGRVTDVRRLPANMTLAGIRWSYEPEFWMANSMVIQYCATRDLSKLGTNISPTLNMGNCSSTTVDADVIEHVQTGLRPFTEYNVTVQANLRSINYSGVPTEKIVRTYPETPLLVQTLPTGLLHIMWAQKVAEFQEYDRVMLDVTNSSNPDTKMVSKVISPIGITVSGIALGATYHVSLKEQEGKKRTENKTVLAYPACPCQNCQIGGWCYVLGDEQTDGRAAHFNCIKMETKLVTIEKSSQVDHLLKVAESLRDDLWVDAASKRLTSSESTNKNTLPLMEEVTDNEIITDAKPSDKCLVVSRSQRAVVVEACSIMHTPACSHKAPVASAFPPTDSITKLIGGNWISLDWEWDFGWKANYTVYYMRTQEKRYKRALREQQFASPPVVISDLQSETPYTLELVADLGEGFLSSSEEFDVQTNSDTRPYSHRKVLSISVFRERISYLHLRRLYLTNGKVPSPRTSSSPLKVGAVPIGQSQIMQLVCSSLLVAACITTMLLFFATGMFYQDCIAQLAFLGTLMAAFLNLMLAHPNPVKPENHAGCIVVAVVLHFLFLCAFMFLMLECLTYAHLLVVQIRSPFQKSNWLLMLFGIIIPIVIVVICAATSYNEYTDYSSTNCWLNGNGNAIYGEAVPIFILVVVSVSLILCTMCNQETPPELIDINLRSRQGDSHKLRWVLLAMVLELGVVWSTGVASYTTRDPVLPNVFGLFTLILAITIVGARTSLDDTFRCKMHRLCCGTELTYKRSEILSLSGKSRISPSPHHHPPKVHSAPSASDSKGYTTTEEKSTTCVPTSQEYSLPNTPPQPDEDKQNYVLIKRSYHFTDDDHDRCF
ncbi:hypothetical protein SK128_013063, partial [Halocaridina rubra]